MIHAWDNYPIEQFPGLWGWMSAQITKQELTMPKVAVEETAHKTPGCGKWLKDAGLRGLDITVDARIAPIPASPFESVLVSVTDNRWSLGSYRVKKFNRQFEIKTEYRHRRSRRNPRGARAGGRLIHHDYFPLL